MPNDREPGLDVVVERRRDDAYEEVEMAPTHPLGVVHRTISGAAMRAGEAAAWGEVDLEIEPGRVSDDVEIAVVASPVREP